MSETEIKSLAKRPCPECGGELEWNPAKQALACPFCGFVPKDQPVSSAAVAIDITEHDLEKALAKPGDEKRGYGTETTSVKCQACQAITVFEPGKVAQRCPFCGSPSIVPYDASRDPITPESLLPVKLDQGSVRDCLKQWYASRWFAPDRLKRAALTDTLHAIYLPYWTFDAQAHADWTAESGQHYYVTVESTDSQGHRTSHQEQRTSWYPSSGSLDHFFDDDLVPGSTGLRMDLLRKVEPFPTEHLSPYDPAFVRGWTVERYQVDLRQASTQSQSQMDAELYRLCGKQVPGDTYRSLSVNSTFAERTFKHILVPIWLCTYTLGAKNYQTVVNGYTGTIAGDRPISFVKIFFYIILPILVLLIIVAIAMIIVAIARKNG